MKDFYSSMNLLMASVKYNIMQYASLHGIALRRVKSWNLGYIFPETIFPAISIFPLSKTFLGYRGDGSSIVEYRLSIDIYSARKANINDSKALVMDMAEEVQKAVKRAIQMIDKSDFKHSFETVIEGQVFQEPPNARKRGLSVTSSIRIVCKAYHQMNEDRVLSRKIKEQNFSDFLDNVFGLVYKKSVEDGIGVKSWISKVSKPLLHYPAVVALPGDEQVFETRTNGMVILNRPVNYYVVTSGIPKWTIIKKNLNIADKLMNIIELYYMVDGYAQDFTPIGIEYTPQESGLIFTSVLNTNYQSRSKLQTSYA